MLRNFLEQIRKNPTEENKELLNYEIERSYKIIQCTKDGIWRALWELELNKMKSVIEYEEWFIKDIEKVRTEIRIILINK